MLSASEVRRIIASVPALDHRVCLITIYSCGLRLGEGLRLEVRDIDAERMLLHIRAGKGNQDRYVPLPERTLLLLRQQWKSHRHPALLFPAKGHNGLGARTATEPISRTTLQRAFRLALQASGVTKQAHVHTLRHSYATHLLERVAPVSLRSGKNRAPAGFRRFDVAGRGIPASQPQPAAAMACS